MSGALAVTARPSPSLNSRSRRLWLVIGLTVAADWLFFGHDVGLSVAVYLVMLCLGAAAANPGRLRRPQAALAAGVLVLALAPLLKQPTLLAVLFAVAGAAYATRVAVGGIAGPGQRIHDALWLLADGSWRAVYDLCRMGRRVVRSRTARAQVRALTVWVVPLVLGLVFVLLFASANPLIDSWLAALDPSSLLTRLSVPRVAFWLLMVPLVWPFVFIRRRRELSAKFDLPRFSSAASVATALSGRLFGTPAILRSLILFNLLFAVQTALDATYLWGGVTLPEGLGYAAYAHRGAYPLVVTALLAAAFVIVALRPGSDAARSPLVRRLVFLWVAQNVALVLSAILRLDLYVAVYSLTQLRVAAFVWMLLVGIGLVLIVARVVLDRSNRWLVAANLMSLALTLYLCGFINFPRLIAEYNVDHSREIAGAGSWLDTDYILALGPQVIPALDRYIARLGPDAAGHLIELRNGLAAAHRARMADWRAWSRDDGQLLRYLDRTIAPGAD